MNRFKYRLQLVYLTPDNIIVTRRNSLVDLYLRLRRKESLFPPDCLIIARLGFKKERIGHGTHFLNFLITIAEKYNLSISDWNPSMIKAEPLPKSWVSVR